MQLIHKDDNDALFRTVAAGAGKVVLSKFAWVIPVVHPNDVLKVNLYKSIAANNTIPVGFRRRQCETFTLPQARSPSGDWMLALHRKSHDRYWLDCRQATCKLFDLKLQIHAIEAEPSLPLSADVIEHTIVRMLDPVLRGYTSEIAIHLCVYSFVVSCSSNGTHQQSYTRL